MGKINLANYIWERYNILDTTTKRSYPLAVINIIRRRAEDLLLNNIDDQKGKDALKFILSLSNERSDLEEMKKGEILCANYHAIIIELLSLHIFKTTSLFSSDVKRKLGFLGKEGYDIFGKNKMFAPRVKWQSLENTVKDIRDTAESYENAFNDIMSTVKSDQNFEKVSDSNIHKIYKFIPCILLPNARPQFLLVLAEKLE